MTKKAVFSCRPIIYRVDILEYNFVGNMDHSKIHIGIVLNQYLVFISAF